MEGLGIKKGRLVNNRPDNISGIQEAVMVKKAAKQAKKVKMIADGIKLSELM